MPSSMAIAISTRGHVCRASDVATVVEELVPGLNATSLEPAINTEGKKPPEFDVVAVDPVPDASAKGAESPEFRISPVIDPIPSADTKRDSKTPEVKIKPIEDLVPTIVNKGD